MFYHQFILAKKAPLARVWLAAHWERKLSKALVSETDLPSSVESIISPKVKLALRTSGHLLLGVVRIYSRKTKYLLADCTEAFVKIKMAFRPGVVDLPEEGRELAFAAVTMPEVFTDLDMTLPELNEVEIHAQFTLNQGRIEEITMKEDIITNNFIGDDGFGDILFEGELEPEIFRHEPSVEEPLNQSNDVSKLSLIEGGEPKGISDSTLEKSRLDIALDEPLRDDGFGGEGVDFLADGFGDELGGGDALVPGFDDLPTTVAAADVTLEPVDTNLDEHNLESADVEPAQDEGVNETANETTLLHNEAEAFVLEPVEVVQREKRSRRKRKLIVDDEKILATEAIKSQLADTTDIVKPATLAPPTKCRMKLKISSTAEKLFALPGTEFFASPVVDAFIQNLTKEVNGESDTTESEEKMDVDEPEIAREEEDVSGIYEGSKRSSVSFANIEANETGLPEEPVHPALEDNERPVEEEEPFLASGVEDIYPNRDELEDNELEQELTASQTNEEQQSSETSEQFENRRWTKRTQQLLHTLKREFQKKDSVSFGSLVHKSSRKQVAYKFYSCLLLSKESSINVHQKKPFGDISISKGQNFDSVC